MAQPSSLERVLVGLEGLGPYDALVEPCVRTAKVALYLGHREDLALAQHGEHAVVVKHRLTRVRPAKRDGEASLVRAEVWLAVHERGLTQLATPGDGSRLGHGLFVEAKNGPRRKQTLLCVLGFLGSSVEIEELLKEPRRSELRPIRPRNLAAQDEATRRARGHEVEPQPSRVLLVFRFHRDPGLRERGRQFRHLKRALGHGSREIACT